MRSKRSTHLMLITGGVGIVLTLGVAFGLVMYLFFCLVMNTFGDWGKSG